MARRDLPQIPLAYRAFLLWLEPFLAAQGAFMAAFRADEYFEVMTPAATAIANHPEFRVVFDQLAATYLLFAFNSAVVLRLSGELRVWKAMLAGIAICDIVHIYATAKALGMDVFLDPMQWRPVDW